MQYNNIIRNDTQLHQKYPISYYKIIDVVSTQKEYRSRHNCWVYERFMTYWYRAHWCSFYIDYLIYIFSDSHTGDGQNNWSTH